MTKQPTVDTTQSVDRSRAELRFTPVTFDEVQLPVCTSKDRPANSGQGARDMRRSEAMSRDTTQSVDLAELRRLLEGATPGPWWPSDYGPKFGAGDYIAEVSPMQAADTALIAAARNSLPALLDRLSALEAVAEAARDIRCIVPSDPCDAHVDEAGFRRCDQCRVVDALAQLEPAATPREQGE